MENYEICKDCKIELRATKNPRLRPTSCADCKITSYNLVLFKCTFKGAVFMLRLSLYFSIHIDCANFCAKYIGISNVNWA